jgi:hypothetical protein
VAGSRIAFSPSEAVAAETDRTAAFAGPLIVPASEAALAHDPRAGAVLFRIPTVEETVSGAVRIGVMAQGWVTLAAGADRTAAAAEVTTTDADVAPPVADGDKFIEYRSKNCGAGDMDM